MARGALPGIILVDTSVWVDFLNGAPGPHVSALESYLSEGADLCICGVILTEVLQGIRSDKEYAKTKSSLDALLFLPMRHSTFVEAAAIYRSLRRKGITIRKPIDCLIAAVAIEHGAALLHNDRDFDPIAKHCGLKTAALPPNATAPSWRRPKPKNP